MTPVFRDADGAEYPLTVDLARWLVSVLKRGACPPMLLNARGESVVLSPRTAAMAEKLAEKEKFVAAFKVFQCTLHVKGDSVGWGFALSEGPSPREESPSELEEQRRRLAA